MFQAPRIGLVLSSRRFRILAGAVLVGCGFLGFVLTVTLDRLLPLAAQRERYLYAPRGWKPWLDEPAEAAAAAVPPPGAVAQVGGGSTDPIPLDIRLYRAVPGDTMSSIALKFALDLDTIASLNREWGSGVHQVRVGETIKIPNQDGIFIRLPKGQELEALCAGKEIPAEVVLLVNGLRREQVRPGDDLFFPGVQHTGVERSVATGEAFLKPVQGWFSSPFGYRQDPFTGMHTFHRGVDMAAPMGTRVRATLDGTVTAVGEDRVLGLHIVIRHQMGYTSVYGHLSRAAVHRGQLVRRGDQIGAVGSSGRSTGSHLHFELRRHGVPVNSSRLVLGMR